MNKEQLNELWHNACQIIRNSNEIDPSQMEAFFSRLQPQVMSEGFLMLTTDNQFIKSWVESHYLENIRQALFILLEIPFVVAIEVDESQPTPAPTYMAQNPATIPGQSAAIPTVNQEPPAIPDVVYNAAPAVPHPPTTQPESVSTSAPEQTYTPVTYTPSQSDSSATCDYPSNGFTPETDSFTSSLTFENYVIGESNSMAYSMAMAVAETPGINAFNPLFIYGKSGLGKTHLMRAIENYILATQRHLKCVYVDSAEFLSDYMEASAAHDKEKLSYKNFKDRYESADVLLIDDIQYLQGKKQTLEIVFQIFNKMKDNNKQIVLSADRAPKNIDIDERYQSRFNSGATIDIQPPEIETKLGIIKIFINEYLHNVGKKDISIPTEVQVYIAENSSSNIRELKSAVTKILNSMIFSHKTDITIGDAKVLLENHFSGGLSKVITVEDIQEAVASFYRIKVSDLVGKTRVRDIVTCRHICIYLCRMLTTLPYDTIGKKFNRDHSTALNSVVKVEGMIKDSSSTAEEIETLKKIIRDSNC